MLSRPQRQAPLPGEFLHALTLVVTVPGRPSPCSHTAPTGVVHLAPR